MFKSRFEELISDSAVGENKTTSDSDYGSKESCLDEKNDSKDADDNPAGDDKTTCDKKSVDAKSDNKDKECTSAEEKEANCESKSADEKSESNSGAASAPSKARFEDSISVFMIGDVVKAKLGFMMFEGVVVGIADPATLEVDFGDEVEPVPRVDCSLVISGLEFEVGDLVSACPIGGFLYFNGVIVNINLNGTFDVQFDGDDEEDIERNIRPENIRKLRTGRQLVMSRWQKAKNLISATRAFAAVP
jgi:hypothetical protein